MFQNYYFPKLWLFRVFVVFHFPLLVIKTLIQIGNSLGVFEVVDSVLPTDKSYSIRIQFTFNIFQMHANQSKYCRSLCLYVLVSGSYVLLYRS